MAWTEHEDDVLRRLAAKGYSLSEAAKYFGFTRSKVAGRAWRLGIKFRGALGRKDLRTVRLKSVS